MPFIDSSESIRAKAHVSNVSPPMLVGVAVLALVALAWFAFNLVSATQEQSFSLESADKGALVSGDHGAAVEPSIRSHAADGATSANEALDGASSGNGQAADAGGDQLASVVVFVSGEVCNPGVYTLPAGARVADALEAAGGFAEGASPDAVNLARVVVDGEQIAILSVEEAQQAADQQPQTRPETVADSAPDSGLVNLNTADEVQLTSLPGIGPATAAKIVASRESEGLFATTADLMRVSGIGEKKFAAIEDLVCV